MVFGFCSQFLGNCEQAKLRTFWTFWSTLLTSLTRRTASTCFTCHCPSKASHIQQLQALRCTPLNWRAQLSHSVDNSEKVTVLKSRCLEADQHHQTARALHTFQHPQHLEECKGGRSQDLFWTFQKWNSSGESGPDQFRQPHIKHRSKTHALDGAVPQFKQRFNLSFDAASKSSYYKTI